jgi:hypothetical protein
MSSDFSLRNGLNVPEAILIGRQSHLQAISSDARVAWKT